MQTLRVTHEHYIIFEITMLSTQISYKYHIYSQCRLEERPINLIVYLIYLVKYTNLVQSYFWPHFQFIVLLNLMFTMLSTQISYKYHI